MEEERIRDLLWLRDSLKRQIEKTERRLNRLRRMLETIDEVLIRVSIAPGTQVGGPPPASESGGEVRRIMVAGEEIGTLSFGGGGLSFNARDDAEIPFRGSLLEGWYVKKVLDPLRSEGKLDYEVGTDDAGRLVHLRITSPSDEIIRDLSGKLIWAIRRVSGERTT